MDKPTDSEHVQAAGYQGGDEMNAPAINRKQRRQARVETQQQKPVDTPIPREYAAPACSCCKNLQKEGSNYSRVYGRTRTSTHVVRYIKCTLCGHTWKDIRSLFNDR
jgi:hypothetical protein